MSKYPRTHAAKALEAKAASQRQELREICTRKQRAYEVELESAHLPDNWLNNPHPLCPVCSLPSDTIEWRPDPREWLGTYGMPMRSCEACFYQFKLEN